MAHQWYIVHAYSNFEKKVAESIKEQASQAGPHRSVRAGARADRGRGRSCAAARSGNSERKFFPGYVLVKMELNDETWHLVKNTPKVTGFLGSGNKPIAVSQKEVDQILNQVQEGVERPKPSVRFEIGEQVRVTMVRSRRSSGSVEEVDEERSRLKVAVSIFGRATPVELEYGQVEKV